MTFFGISDAWRRNEKRENLAPLIGQRQNDVIYYSLKFSESDTERTSFSYPVREAADQFNYLRQESLQIFFYLGFVRVVFLDFLSFRGIFSLSRYIIYFLEILKNNDLQAFSKLTFGVVLTFSKITFRKIFDCQKNVRIFFIALSNLY